MKKLMMLGAILLVTGLVQAGAVPELVNYQGRLTDDDGDALATGDYKLKFEVHTDPYADTRVWGPLCFDYDSGSPPTGHKLKAPVVQGYFNVVLDYDNGYDDCAHSNDEDSPAPITDAFRDSQRYVEVAVWDPDIPPSGDWVAILPRQQVLSAPYGLRADSSREVVSGVDETTRIACQTATGTMVDVVTVGGTPPTVDVNGELVCDSLTANDLNVASITGVSLEVNGTADIEDWATQVKSQSGYAWIGGILLQWGVRTSHDDVAETHFFEIPFPNECFAVTFSIPGVGSRSTNSFTIDRINDYSNDVEFSFVAVGY